MSRIKLVLLILVLIGLAILTILNINSDLRAKLDYLESESKKTEQVYKDRIAYDNLIKSEEAAAEKERRERQDKVDRLTRIFSKYPKNPMGAHIETFIDTAERYELDWRILPAITLAEQGTGCSEAFNCFGFSNGGTYSRLAPTREAEIERAAYLLQYGFWADWEQEEKMAHYNSSGYSYTGFYFFDII